MDSVPNPASSALPSQDRDRPSPFSVQISNDMQIPSHSLHLGPQQDQSLVPDDAQSSALRGERDQSGVSKMPPHSVSESDAAAVLQKVYRGYRTRRCLADHAVMNKEIAWWNVLEGALLRQKSETFYAYEQKDTAASRWSRLQKKAAKVGKGLSKDEKARKLAIQHWLEAIDPRHRYGHNLHYYYSAWEKSSTKEPFFYWLDVGEGKEVDLHECKRSKLQKQQIRYLGPVEREQYEVVVDAGKLRYKKSWEIVDTPKGDKWIFVMSASGKLYIARKDKGSFQHSSFLAGAATKAAGRLLVSNGTLELMEAHSGHYRPTEENFDDLVNILKELGTDLRMAKVQNVSDDMLIAENESMQKFPSNAIIEMCEMNVATKACETEFWNVREVQINEPEITKQSHALTSCGAHDEKEKPIKSLSNSGSQDFQTLLPSSNALQGQLPHEMVSNIESHVKVELQSTGMLDKITIFDKPAETISSVHEALDEAESAQTVDEEESAQMVLFQPAETNHARKWTSGAGPRIASLSGMPREMLLKVLEDIENPCGASA